MSIVYCCGISKYVVGLLILLYPFDGFVQMPCLLFYMICKTSIFTPGFGWIWGLNNLLDLRLVMMPCWI